MAKTITSANASFILTIPALFPAPITLQGFAADDMFTADAQNATEAVMGVDGHLSIGFAFHPVKIKLKLMPDSPSIAYFDAWYAAQATSHDAYFGNAVITMPGNGTKYVAINGALTSYKMMPDAKKLLQAQEYDITFESVTKASM